MTVLLCGVLPYSPPPTATSTPLPCRRQEVKEAPPAEEPAANGEGEAAEKEGEEEAAAEVRFRAASFYRTGCMAVQEGESRRLPQTA